MPDVPHNLKLVYRNIALIKIDTKKIVEVSIISLWVTVQTFVKTKQYSLENLGVAAVCWVFQLWSACW